MTALEVVPWALAAFLLALWWGERARRIDAQLQQQGRRVGPPPPPATVIPPGGMGGEEPLVEIEPPERFVQQLMNETGCSADEAEAEWRRLILVAGSDRVSPW